MRQRVALVAAPIMGCVAAAFLATPASAAPCPPEVAAALTLHAPERAAYERGFSAQISRPFTEERLDVKGLRVSFQPASRGGKLASAFTANPSPPKAEFEEFETRTLWFASGDGPGLLTARWTQGDRETGVVCEESQSIEIQPIRGRLSPVHAELRWEKGSHEFTLEMPCAAGEKEEFEVVSPAPVLVTIKGADGRKIARVPDVCLESSFKAFETRNWAIYRTLVGANVGIQVSSFGIRRPTQMRFDVRQAGKLTAQGRFHIWDRSRPSRRIYEGSDAFVNYCINQTRVIRSSHGRLYCVYPGYYRTFASGLHWSAFEASKE